MARHSVIAGLAIALVAGTYSAPASADVPKFGKTCLGKSGWNTDVCVSSNGKTLSSTYKWKGKVSTRGSHTGCKLNGSTIACSGGTFTTSQGSGKMDAASVKLSNGKPVSMRWN